MVSEAQRAEELREMHRARLAAWGLPARDAHEDDVIARCLDGEDPPFLHEHAIEEMGMCVECDAASILLREGSDG